MEKFEFDFRAIAFLSQQNAYLIFQGYFIKEKKPDTLFFYYDALVCLLQQKYSYYYYFFNIT